MRRLGVLLAVLSLSTVFAGQVATGSSEKQLPTTYKGVGTGDLDRTRELDNMQQTQHVVAHSHDHYNVRFTYSFEVSGGSVKGTGKGSYLAATWHLDGHVDADPFSCDVPIRTTPFTVAITGTAGSTTMHLQVRLVGAQESNDEVNCGANYYAHAGQTEYIAQSLASVLEDRGGSITVSRPSPSIPLLSKDEDFLNNGDPKDHRIIHHRWAFTIRASPSGGGGTGGGGGGGAGGGYGSGNNNGPCTVSGTAGNDTLTGSAGADVICGLGGKDHIRGLGGDDTLRGGPGSDFLDGGPGHDTIDGGPGADRLYGRGGRDLLLARDRHSDLVSGGPQKDRARIDAHRDKVHGVEVLH